MNHWKQYIIKISILKSCSSRYIYIYIQERFIHTARVFISFSPKHKLPPGVSRAEAHTKSHLVLLHSCLKPFIFHKLQKKVPYLTISNILWNYFHKMIFSFSFPRIFTKLWFIKLKNCWIYFHGYLFIHIQRIVLLPNYNRIWVDIVYPL